MEPKSTIIIIEDEKNICSFIETILEAHGYVTSTATNGNDGIALIASTKPSVVLLDLGLPDIDGLEVIRRVRLWSTVPIIVISARTQEKSKVAALDQGADDYLTKPFSLSVLRSRIQAHLQREHRRLWDFACDWQLDPYQQICFKRHPLNLTRSEKEILMALHRQPSRIWTKEQLLALIHGWDRCSEPAAMTEHIKNIRSKCRKWHSDPIETVWGIGYRWKNEDAEKPKP